MYFHCVSLVNAVETITLYTGCTLHHSRCSEHSKARAQHSKSENMPPDMDMRDQLFNRAVCTPEIQYSATITKAQVVRLSCMID